MPAAHEQEMERMLTGLAGHDSIRAEVSGSADYLGNVAFNQEISDERVFNVRDYLSGKRDGWIFEVQSKGEVNRL